MEGRSELYELSLELHVKCEADVSWPLQCEADILFTPARHLLLLRNLRDSYDLLQCDKHTLFRQTDLFNKVFPFIYRIFCNHVFSMRLFLTRLWEITQSFLGKIMIQKVVLSFRLVLGQNWEENILYFSTLKFKNKVANFFFCKQ
jgi:hypothetical protein